MTFDQYYQILKLNLLKILTCSGTAEKMENLPNKYHIVQFNDFIKQLWTKYIQQNRFQMGELSASAGKVICIILTIINSCFYENFYN